MAQNTLNAVGLGLAFSIGIVTVFTTTTAQAASACHCRTATGDRVLVGNYTCIKTSDGLKEARCEYVLNNTAWKPTGNLCPSVNLTPKDKEPQLTVAQIYLRKYKSLN